MYGLGLRIPLVVALVVIGIAALRQDMTGVGGALLVIAGLQVWTYFRHAAVHAAGRAFRAGKGVRAQSLLAQTPFGGRTLARGVRPYFHLLRSACLLDEQRWQDAADDAQHVLSLDTTAMNVSTAHGALAKAHLMQGDLKLAAAHLAKARALPHKPALDRLLGSVANALEEANGETPPTSLELRE